MALKEQLAWIKKMLVGRSSGSSLPEEAARAEF
jgi:hypothetical protein